MSPQYAASVLKKASTDIQRQETRFPRRFVLIAKRRLDRPAPTGVASAQARWRVPSWGGMGRDEMNRLGLFAVVISAVVIATLGAVAPVHAAANGGAFVCKNQSLVGGTISGNLVVPTGAYCDLSGTHVTGNALVQPKGGLLSDNASSIDGNVRLQNNGQFAEFNGSKVGRDVRCDHCAVADAQSSTIGGSLLDDGISQGAFIRNDQIGGNLVIWGGRTVPNGPFDIEGNTIGSNLGFFNNRGSSTISNNAISETLACSGNQPPPAGSGNTAEQKKGQCASL
jgi:hypothetical protein